MSRALRSAFRIFAAQLSILLGTLSSSASEQCAPPESIAFTVRHAIRRSATAFTEGLVFHDDRLFESSGKYGSSSLNRIHPVSGIVDRLVELPDSLFGEGLDRWKNRFLLLTWKERVALLWEEGSLDSPPERKSYFWDGWGLTHDETHWIVSDGSAILRFLDEESLSADQELVVRRGSARQPGLNELEFLDGRIFANVFPESRILRINPQTGCVDGELELTAILAFFTVQETSLIFSDPEAVANGIAFDPESRLLYVTGKNWPLLFALDLK